MDFISLSLLGMVTGCIVGLLSAGGGMIIFPMLHAMYPDLSSYAIVTVCLNQILFSGFVAYGVHNRIQKTHISSLQHKLIYFVVLIAMTLYISWFHMNPAFISILFILFLAIGLALRLVMKLGVELPFNDKQILLSLIFTSVYGVTVGMGGSLILYPLLRIGQLNPQNALRLCAYNAFAVGLIGAIAHNLSYVFEFHAEPFPWKILCLILITSSVTSFYMTQFTYKLKGRTIDHLSNILIAFIIVFYSYELYVG